MRRLGSVVRSSGALRNEPKDRFGNTAFGPSLPRVGSPHRWSSSDLVVIENGTHLRQAREAMGWTPEELARALRFAENHGGSRVLEMETGKRRISGPVAVSVEAFLRGYLPVGFEAPRRARPAQR